MEHVLLVAILWQLKCLSLCNTLSITICDTISGKRIEHKDLESKGSYLWDDLQVRGVRVSKSQDTPCLWSSYIIVSCCPLLSLTTTACIFTSWMVRKQALLVSRVSKRKKKGRLFIKMLSENRNNSLQERCCNWFLCDMALLVNHVWNYYKCGWFTRWWLPWSSNYNALSLATVGK